MTVQRKINTDGYASYLSKIKKCCNFQIGGQIETTFKRTFSNVFVTYHKNRQSKMF